MCSSIKKYDTNTLFFLRYLRYCSYSLLVGLPTSFHWVLAGQKEDVIQPTNKTWPGARALAASGHNHTTDRELGSRRGRRESERAEAGGAMATTLSLSSPLFLAAPARGNLLRPSKIPLPFQSLAVLVLLFSLRSLLILRICCVTVFMVS